VFAFNPRAIHVYKKLGFKREGVRREVLFWDGEYHDVIVMGLLRREFTEQS
jgi:RimJ/RimL family protein N-acetyltransferase